jgi:hypothetical protein
MTNCASSAANDTVFEHNVRFRRQRHCGGRRVRVHEAGARRAGSREFVNDGQIDWVYHAQHEVENVKGIVFIRGDDLINA